MGRLRRALLLWIVCAHWAAAALPCAPLLPAAAEAPHATAADAATGHDHAAAPASERDPHAAHRHGGAPPDSPLALTAPCPCGCEAEPDGAGPIARVGTALLPHPAEFLGEPARPEAAPFRVLRPPAPDLRRDRVPI